MWTLYDALQDIGKGRFIDTGCDYQIIALAKGFYKITMQNGKQFEITLDGKQGENAWQIEKKFYEFCYQTGTDHTEVRQIEYRRIRK